MVKAPVITIGMIVKNEEEDLECCLKSLEKVMSQLPCELIIADTGSTDGTVEIAEKYADEVFYFEWINDFSAARNAVMEKAKGEWYWSIDADEKVDEDISDLVHFFESEERHKYDIATVSSVNYVKGKTESILDKIIMFRMKNKPRFQGRIHETVPFVHGVTKIKNLSTIVHHYGYYYESIEEQDQKHKRNMELIEEALKDTPNDLRMLASAADSSHTFEERKQYVDKISKLVQKHPKNVYAKSSYMRILSYHRDLKEVDQLWQAISTYIDRYKKTESIADVDVYYYAVQTLLQRKQFDQIHEYAEHYYDLWKKMEQNKLDRIDALFATLDAIQRECVDRVLQCEAEAYFQLKDYEAAAGCMYAIDLSEVLLSNSVSYLVLWVKVLSHHKDVDLANKVIRWFDDIAEKEEKEQFQKVYHVLDVCFALSGKKEQQLFASQIAACRSNDPWMQLVRLYYNKLEISFEDDFQHYVSQVEDWERVSPILYTIALQNGMLLPQEAFRLSMNRKDVVTGNVVLCCKEFGEVFLDYCQQYPVVEDVFQCSWFLMAGEKFLRRKDVIRIRTGSVLMLKQYAALMERYLPAIFAPEVLEEPYITMIPVGYQFGYWLKEAFYQEAKGNFKEAVELLKKCINTDNLIQPMIKFVLDDINEKLAEDTETATKSEFDQLSKEVKKKINDFIQAGFLVQAKELLDTLQQLTPKDEEIGELLDKIAEKQE